VYKRQLVVTSLNSSDKWRIAKLEGKDPKRQPKTPAKEAPKKEEPVKVESKETKVAEKATKKEIEK